MLPAIKFDMFTMSIDKDLIDISISGSIVADVLNLFIQLFKGVIVDIMVNAINNQTPAMVTSEVNTLFYDSQGLMMFGDLGFDFAYTAAPKVWDTQIDMYLNATFFNSSFGVISPNEGFGDLYIDTASNDCVQMDISQYTVESLFLTL